MTPTQTALVVPVPEAEPVVAEHRRRFDPSSPWGVPAHVTVLYPFVEPAAVDDRLLRRVAAAVAGIGPFPCHFRECRWFDQDVLWLAPEPAEPFRALTLAVWEEFPDHPPYGGAHPDLQPHLTVGQRDAGIGTGTGTALAQVEPLVAAQLPVTTYVRQVHLIAGAPAPDSWRTVERFDLTAPAD